MAVQFLDLLWSPFLLLGIEHARIAPGITVLTPFDFFDYPYTHSLLASLVWGVLFAGGFWILKRENRAAVVLGLCVVSHWFLDLLVHRPDLPLIPQAEAARFGLGLWNYPWVSIPLEGMLFVFGIFVFWKSFRPSIKRKKTGFIALSAILGCIWIANFMGPPPPNIAVVGASGLALWLFVVWGYWVDACFCEYPSSS